MLYTKTVERNTLGLLRQLQKEPYLKGYYLVGRTALALKIGHRKSIDIDLFSDFSFDVNTLLEKLQSNYDYQMFHSAQNTLKGSIDGIKVDLLSHRYPLIREPLFEEEIAMLSIPDIIAMKLNAISGSGQRVKDFIDIWFLLSTYSLDSMISYYKEKYTNNNEAVVLKSLVYFDDIDMSDWPVIISEPKLKWKTVATELEKQVMVYTKSKIL